ncbi:MAG: hypothetical protein DRN81_06300 [Thermoproteota archaeon]|nr:MAG: hypothetical protein DRN81_06300 [Candidatus Korarchaeota archaeon]
MRKVDKRPFYRDLLDEEKPRRREEVRAATKIIVVAALITLALLLTTSLIELRQQKQLASQLLEEKTELETELSNVRLEKVKLEEEIEKLKAQPSKPVAQPGKPETELAETGLKECQEKLAQLTQEKTDLEKRLGELEETLKQRPSIPAPKDKEFKMTMQFRYLPKQVFYGLVNRAWDDIINSYGDKIREESLDIYKITPFLYGTRITIIAYAKTINDERVSIIVKYRGTPEGWEKTYISMTPSPA